MMLDHLTPCHLLWLQYCRSWRSMLMNQGWQMIATGYLTNVVYGNINSSVTRALLHQVHYIRTQHGRHGINKHVSSRDTHTHPDAQHDHSFMKQFLVSMDFLNREQRVFFFTFLKFSGSPVAGLQMVWWMVGSVVLYGDGDALPQKPPSSEPSSSEPSIRHNGLEAQCSPALSSSKIKEAGVRRKLM